MIDPKLARLAHTAEVSGILYGACFDAETGNFYGAGADGSVYRIDGRAEKPAAEKKWTHHDNYISALAWHRGTVYSAGYDKRVVWTSAESGEKQREIAAHDGWVRDLALLPGGGHFATAGDDMLVKLWDAKNGELLYSLEGHARQTPEGFATAIYALAASPDGRYLASADRIGEVMIWEIATGTLAAKIKSPEFYTFDPTKRARSIGGIRSLLFLDGGRLVLGGIGPISNVDGFVGPARFEIWDWQAAKRLYRGQDKHNAILDCVLHLPEQDLLIGGGGGDAGPFLGFWNLKDEPPLRELPVHKAKPKAHIQHLAFDPQSQRLLPVGHGGFQIWEFTPAPEAKKDEKK
jgi:WD40 repeat protein